MDLLIGGKYYINGDYSAADLLPHANGMAG